MLRAVKIKVSGKVQGVFFRASTQQEAQKLRLRGWCMNLPDGGVEIFAEGDSDNVDQLIEWCRLGPPMAKVYNCVVLETEPMNYPDFSIKRS